MDRRQEQTYPSSRPAEIQFSGLKPDIHIDQLYSSPTDGILWFTVARIADRDPKRMTHRLNSIDTA